MLGAIVGDIVGSVYERRGNAVKTLDFRLFSDYSHWTDDTVLTMAVADTLLSGRPYSETIRSYALEHPHAGYGHLFKQWFYTPGAGPYNSFGNGSAMRVSPVGWAFQTLEETLAEAQRSAEVTHNHPDGIKGAQSVAAAIFLAREGATQADICEKYAEPWDNIGSGESGEFIDSKYLEGIRAELERRGFEVVDGSRDELFEW